MSTTHQKSDEAQLLPVHVVESLAGDGTTSSRMAVRCPSRQGMASIVEDCSRCGFATDVQADGDGGHLACAFPSNLRTLPAAAPANVLRSIRKTRVAAVMSRKVLSFSPDVSIEDATTQLLERRISGAPVVDATGRLIGMVSKTDLLRSRHDRTDELDASCPTARPRDEREIQFGFHDETVATATVGEIMTPVVFTLADSASLATALAMMTERRIHRVPIMSGVQLVGILTPVDVMRWIAATPNPDDGAEQR